MMKTGATVIIINYNTERLVMDCLKSLTGQTFRNFEVILVDNGSCPGSLDEVKASLGDSPLGLQVRFVPLADNSGFAWGNLIGLQYAASPYVALLNSDTEPAEGWLGALVAAMETHPDAGICASQMLVYNAKTVDSAGDGFARTLQGFKRQEGALAPLSDELDYVFGACAGAALYRREMLNQIGFLDEDFFLIHEDTDLNLRAQLAGWKTLYVPTAVVEHKVRSSIGHMSDVAVYYTIRNRDFVRIKNVPLGVFLACLPEFLFGVISEFFYFAIKHRRFNLYFKAKCDAIRMFPKMLRKREEIMKHKTVSNRYLLSIMTPVWNKDFVRAKLKKFFYG